MDLSAHSQLDVGEMAVVVMILVVLIVPLMYCLRLLA
jgi:hypothetical protein